MLDDFFKKLKNSFLFSNNGPTNNMRSNSVNRGFGMGFRSRQRSMLNYKLVSYDQAKEMIENNEILLIDVRSKAEYDVIHVRNSINIPVNDLENEILLYDKLKNIMVYCTTGTRSKNAIQILNSLGYNNIYIWEYAALSNFPFKEMLEYKEKTL